MPDLFSLHFLWSPLLWGLLLLPVLLVVQLRLGRRGLAAAAGRPSVGSRLWQQLPFALLLLGLALLVVASARPQAVMLTPVREATVMLAIDTSGSMRATDLQPSRIEAARAAAERFIEAKPGRLRVGLVTIAGTAALAQAPTEERDELRRALEHLPLQYGSALGTGVLIALEALLPGAGIDAQKIINEAMDGPVRRKSEGQPLLSRPQASQAGVEQPDGRAKAIVLISDGQGNMGPELLEMAKLAAAHRVRVYTVGVGTPEGAVVQVQGRSMRVRLEEDLLRQVARLSQGEYFRATSTEGLHQVYEQLGHRLRFEKRAQSEITGAVAMLGMLLVLAGSLLSLQRFGRIV